MGDGWQRARANLQTEDSGRDALREQDWFEIVWKAIGCRDATLDISQPQGGWVRRHS
jgi:hypothetical protein